eukprot:gb/GEZN01023620.1/.p2 GENE.gb/GEZN01023620.1/~~gb/GEZN01023620.1/.p2  ORF type:complete len:100 (-),score=19.85 gb/GEZN01023620.1/:80-379(-)
MLLHEMFMSSEATIKFLKTTPVSTQRTGLMPSPPILFVPSALHAGMELSRETGLAVSSLMTFGAIGGSLVLVLGFEKQLSKWLDPPLNQGGGAPKDSDE